MPFGLWDVFAVIGVATVSVVVINLFEKVVQTIFPHKEL